MISILVIDSWYGYNYIVAHMWFRHRLPDDLWVVINSFVELEDELPSLSVDAFIRGLLI